MRKPATLSQLSRNSLLWRFLVIGIVALAPLSAALLQFADDEREQAIKAAREKAQADQAAAADRPGADFPATGRFVVQVGAYVEDSKVANVRRQLTAAGLSNYTQVVKINGKDATRVRMGPFGTRKEMERVADKVRSLGLPVSVYSY